MRTYYKNYKEFILNKSILKINYDVCVRSVARWEICCGCLSKAYSKFPTLVLFI